jgi:hypothetical protein
MDDALASHKEKAEAKKVLDDILNKAASSEEEVEGNSPPADDHEKTEVIPLSGILSSLTKF